MHRNRVARARIAHSTQRAPIRWFALSVLFSAPSAESAQYTVNYANADTGRWACRLCEFEKATARTGRLAAGALTTTGSEMRFGRDNGIYRSGGYLDLNADFRLATPSGLLLELAARDLGLDARDAALSFWKSQRYGVQVRYRETPRNVSRDGRSPFAGNGTPQQRMDRVRTSAGQADSGACFFKCQFQAHLSIIWSAQKVPPTGCHLRSAASLLRSETQQCMIFS